MICIYIMFSYGWLKMDFVIKISVIEVGSASGCGGGYYESGSPIGVTLLHSFLHNILIKITLV